MEKGILFNMHIMWYESKMINETLDSLLIAINNCNIPVKVVLCLNSQTYLETPLEGEPEDMFECFLSHQIFKDVYVDLIYKTNDDHFYNVGDWRREMYSNQYTYTVWGESDTLIPEDYFYILQQLNILEPHIVSLSSRKMWDDSWIPVEELYIQTLDRNHGDIGIYSSGAYISYPQMCELNRSNDIEVTRLQKIKIDGALLALSNHLPVPFISPDQHFFGEDTAAGLFFAKHNIPQYHITTRIKGHNNNHPLKRTNTNNTRNDIIFKIFSDESKSAMINYINSI